MYDTLKMYLKTLIACSMQLNKLELEEKLKSRTKLTNKRVGITLQCRSVCFL